MPGVPADAYKAKASALHVVAKGRQDANAANSVQVRHHRASLRCLCLQRHEPWRPTVPAWHSRCTA